MSTQLRSVVATTSVAAASSALRGQHFTDHRCIIATIKALRLLDPKGVVLESVAEPAEDYLWARRDTV